MKKNCLTSFESMMLVAGSGIGTGILTLPYAINKIGVFGAITALIVAYFISAIMYLMLSELTLNSKDSKELVGILKEHLFFGKFKKVLSTIFFVIIILMIIQNLIVYILCANDILIDLFNISPIFSKLLFYIVASLVILSGIKGISKGEKVSVCLIAFVIFLLTILSFLNINNHLSFSFGSPSKVMAVYGLFMFAFSSIFSIIQVTNYIDDKTKLKGVLLGGLTINALLTIIFAIAAILCSTELTSIATIGITKSLNIPFVKILCSIFVLLAMFSSYWSSGLAFTEILETQFNISRRRSWLISTIPTIIIALIIPVSILGFVQIGAGALSIILVLVIIPSYLHAVKRSKKPLLGGLAKSKLLIGIVVVFIIIMAIASLIPIG